MGIVWDLFAILGMLSAGAFVGVLVMSLLSINERNEILNQRSGECCNHNCNEGRDCPLGRNDK